MSGLRATWLAVLLGLLVSACTGGKPTGTPLATLRRVTVTPVAVSGTPVPLGDDAAILGVARTASAAILTIDYRDLNGWQARLYALCSDEGRRFWNTNIQRGLLADVVTYQKVTTQVAIQRAVITQIITNAQGQRVAFVAVSGTVTFHDKRGDHQEPFAHTQALVQLDGQSWQLALLTQ